MPGAEAISTKKEGQRIIPVLKQIRSERPDVFLSVDTYKMEASKAPVEEPGVDVEVGFGKLAEHNRALLEEDCGGVRVQPSQKGRMRVRRLRLTM